MKLAFVSSLLLLILALGDNAVSANDDDNNNGVVRKQQRPQGASDEIRRLRGANPKTRKLVADSFMSSMQNKGMIEPQVMEKVAEAGLPADAIQDIAGEAYEKVKSGEASVKTFDHAMKEVRKLIDTKAATEGDVNDIRDNNNRRMVETKEVKNVEDGNNSLLSAGGESNMSYGATKALSKAVLSAYRSPNGQVDQKLMDEAIKAGASRGRILKSLETAMFHKNRKLGEMKAAAAAAAVDETATASTTAGTKAAAATVIDEKANKATTAVGINAMEHEK